MTTQIIENFITNYQGVHLAEDLSSYLKKLLDIQLRRLNLQKEIGLLQKRQKGLMQERKSLDGKYLELTNDCPHPEVIHYSDPSGGTDSYDQCVYCGKEF